MRCFLSVLVILLGLAAWKQQLVIQRLEIDSDSQCATMNEMERRLARHQGALFGLDLSTRAQDKKLRLALEEARKQLITLEETVEIKDHRITSLEKGHMLTITAYSAEPGQTDDTPFITANNNRVREGIVAVSSDLEKRGWKFGRKVYVEGMGVYTIDDRMNPRKTKQLDIFMFNTKKALEFGRQKLRVYLIGAET